MAHARGNRLGMSDCPWRHEEVRGLHRDGLLTGRFATLAERRLVILAGPVDRVLPRPSTPRECAIRGAEAGIGDGKRRGHLETALQGADGKAGPRIFQFDEVVRPTRAGTNLLGSPWTDHRPTSLSLDPATHAACVNVPGS